jgi:hypothetical protein
MRIMKKLPKSWVIQAFLLIILSWNMFMKYQDGRLNPQFVIFGGIIIFRKLQLLLQ